jgi:hypothetical protein
MTDHDRLFKELISTFFVEFLELFLPDVRGYVEADSIEFLDKEIFIDVTSGERLETDLVAKVRFKRQPAFFIIHVENQAQHQKSFGRRFFRYFSRLHDKHDLPVYPIVIFSFDLPRKAQSDVYRVSFPNKVVMEFHYDVVQLNRLKWQDFISSPNPVAAALMSRMDIAVEDRPRVKLECLRLLATLRLNRAKMKLISGFLDSYLELNRQEQAQFQRGLTALATGEKEEVMEIVTSWMKDGLKRGRREGLQQGRQQGLQQGRQQGLQQGRQQGLQQGRQQGLREGIEQGQLTAARDDVLEILEARFKKLPAGIKKSLRAIDDRKRLKRLLRLAATAVSLREFQRHIADLDRRRNRKTEG